MFSIGQIQLGKNGISDNFVIVLRGHFEKYKVVKVSVLRSCSRDKKEILRMADELVEKLGKNYSVKVIGFTMIFRKWRRDVR